MKLDLSAPRYRILVPPSSSSPWRKTCSPPLGRVEAQPGQDGAGAGAELDPLIEDRGAIFLVWHFP